MSKYINYYFLVISLIFSQSFVFGTDSSNSSSSEANVKVITSIVVILGVFFIGFIFLCYCYKTTKNLERLANKVRGELSYEYQNALNLQVEQAVRVNNYLLKSLAPEKPLMGRSMLKSSWRKTNSPKKIKASAVEKKLLTMNQVEMTMPPTSN